MKVPFLLSLGRHSKQAGDVRGGGASQSLGLGHLLLDQTRLRS
jgi:hypothetical protein